MAEVAGGEPAQRCYNPFTMKALVYAAHGLPISPLGPYGNDWIATPNLDRFAASGIVYDRHIAATPDPRAARADWWSKLAAGSDLHAVLVRACRPEHDGPAEDYAGFAEVLEARPQTEDVSPAEALLRQLPQVLKSLEHRPNWLLWIECDRFLPPWDAPQEVFEVYVEDLMEDSAAAESPLVPWLDPPVGPLDRNDWAAWELLHRTLAAAVTQFDADWGRLLDLLDTHGLNSPATVALTSEFGYPLGEHGQVGPFRPWLYEEFVHLPLIVRRPNRADAGQRIAGFTQPADLLAILNDELHPERDCAISHLTLGEFEEWAIRTRTHALLWPRQQPAFETPRQLQLFLKPEDRWEVNDVHMQHLEVVEELMHRLETSTG